MSPHHSPKPVRFVLAVMGLLVLAGCGPPVLETSSLEDLQESIAVLAEPLDEDTRQRFDEALGYLAGGASVADAVADPRLQPLVLELYRPLQGSNVEAILAQALATRTRQVLDQMRPIEEELAAAEAARAELAKLRLGSGRVFKINRGALEWPVIEVAVDNATGHRILMVRLRAALLVPGEPDPWLEEEIDHLILGGLDTEGRDRWRIEPEQQDWIQLAEPHPNPDARFSLEVLRLTTTTKEVLAETRFGSVEEHRLAAYRNTLQAIRSNRELALDRPPRAAHAPPPA